MGWTGRSWVAFACVMAVVWAFVPAPGVTAATVADPGSWEAQQWAQATAFDRTVGTHPVVANGDYHPVVTACSAVGMIEPWVDVLWYGPGSRPDHRWVDVQLSDTGPSYDDRSVNVSGAYVPLVGDFDGDGCDDIFWYGAGPVPDSIWYSNPDHTFEARSVSVSGVYFPVVGHFSPLCGVVGPCVPSYDGVSDILWYGPGSTAESIWTFSRTRGSYSSESAPRVDGVYVPVLMPDQLSVLWYGPGSAPDYVTAPVAGSTTPAMSRRTSVEGSYTAYGARGLLHRPGRGADHLLSGPGTLGPDGSAVLGAVSDDILGSYTIGASTKAAVWVLHGPGSAPDHIMWWFPMDPGGLPPPPG